QSAQTAVGRGPKRTVWIEPKMVNRARPKPVRICVGGTNPTVSDVVDSTLAESQPHTRLPWIRSRRGHQALTIQCAPGDLFHVACVGRDAEQTRILIHDPQTLTVFDDGTGDAARQAGYGNKPIMLEVADTATR